MTQKEKLFKEYLETQNTYYKLTGDTIKIVELTDEYLESLKFKLKALSQTIDEWKLAIRVCNLNIAVFKRKTEINEWFNSEQGQVYRRNIEEEISKRKKEIKSIKDDAIKVISEIINSNISGVWVVDSICDSKAIIQYVGERDEEGQPIVKYNYSFSLEYDFMRGDGRDNFKLNYSNLGPWNLFDDEDDIVHDYLLGVVQFGSDKTMLKRIHEIIKKTVIQINELDVQVDNLTYYLENPEIPRNSK